MSGFSNMLTPQIEKAVLEEAQQLSGVDLSSLLKEQAEAVQHVLAVSAALAKRVEAVGAAVKSQGGKTVASPPKDPASSSSKPNGRERWKQNYQEPLLGPGQDPAGKAIAKMKQQKNPAPKERARGGSFLPDVSSMQSFLKNCLRKDVYRTEDYYKKTGFAQAVARDTNFRNITFLIIFLNTIWIGYDTDNNHADVLCKADTRFIVMENFFCTFFFFEVLCRFFAFKKKKDAVTDGWFMFDAFLVSLMVWETWVAVIIYQVMHDVQGTGGAASILRIFRLFRLTRVARLGRLISAVPELMLLVKSMAMAMRSVGSTLGLMLVLVYIFAILFTTTLKNHPVGEGKYETVPMSINYLLLGSVFPDNKDDIMELAEVSWIYYLAMSLFLLLGSLTIMNMLIGVLCEVVGVVAEAEKREKAEVELKEQLLAIMEKVDDDKDHMIDVREMEKMVYNQEAIVLLDEVGVDVHAMVDNIEYIFQDKSKLSTDEFFCAILRFRDDNTATQKDFVDMQKALAVQCMELNESITSMKMLVQPPPAVAEERETDS